MADPDAAAALLLELAQRDVVLLEAARRLAQVDVLVGRTVMPVDIGGCRREDDHLSGTRPLRVETVAVAGSLVCGRGEERLTDQRRVLRIAREDAHVDLPRTWGRSGRDERPQVRLLRRRQGEVRGRRGE